MNLEFSENACFLGYLFIGGVFFALIIYGCYLLVFKEFTKYKEYNFREKNYALVRVSEDFSIIRVLDTTGKWYSLWRRATPEEADLITTYLKEHPDFKEYEDRD